MTTLEEQVIPDKYKGKEPVGVVTITVYEDVPAQVEFSNLKTGFSFKHAKLADKAFKIALRHRRREEARKETPTSLAEKERTLREREEDRRRAEERKTGESLKKGGTTEIKKALKFYRDTIIKSDGGDAE